MALGETSAAPVNHVEKIITGSTLEDEGSFSGLSFYPEWAGGRASSFGAGTKRLLEEVKA
jgi:hypothetical protein